MAPHRIVVAETDHGSDAHPQLNMNNTWIFLLPCGLYWGKEPGIWKPSDKKPRRARRADLWALVLVWLNLRAKGSDPWILPLVHRSPNGPMELTHKSGGTPESQSQPIGMKMVYLNRGKELPRATNSGWDFPLLTFTYPGFDSCSHLSPTHAGKGATPPAVGTPSRGWP